MSPRERGAAGIALLGVMVVALLMAAVVADAGSYLSARSRAAAAADAAALAAAPVTFRAFGAEGGPRHEAARFAAANGGRLVACRCSVDRSFDRRTVHVTVVVAASTLLFGEVAVTGDSRAEFQPVHPPEPPAP